MNMVALLIGLGPLLGWGLFPTIASKFGGKPVNQIIGTFGNSIFSVSEPWFWIFFIISVNASAPISSIGCATVVSEGIIYLAKSISSYPTNDKSFGTDRALALTLIMKKIQNQGSDTEKIELPNKLVVRETTRRINWMSNFKRS